MFHFAISKPSKLYRRTKNNSPLLGGFSGKCRDHINLIPQFGEFAVKRRGVAEGAMCQTTVLNQPVSALHQAVERCEKPSLDVDLRKIFPLHFSFLLPSADASVNRSIFFIVCNAAWYMLVQKILPKE
ncbi:MAG: hypothetical protein LBC56_07680 [Oscillospiraceae bacterium]|nr:hypothetical protein [Oscillospiraceae bacterium]